MAVSTFKITGQTAAGGITVGVLELAQISASIAGAGTLTSAVLLNPAAIGKTLAGAGTISIDAVVQPSLSNDAASVSGYDITTTATSSSDLSASPRVYGVEYGRVGTYNLSKNIAGAAANQSITIGFTDGITNGVWNVRDYLNINAGDPYTLRAYSGATFTLVAGGIGASLAGAGTLTASVLQQQIIAAQTLAGVGTLTANVTGGSAPVVVTVAATGSGAGRAFRYYRVPEKLPEIKRELERVALKVKKTTLAISLRKSNEDLKRLLEMLNRLQEQYAQLRYAYEEATRAMLTRAEAEEESEFMDFIARL